MSLSLVSSAQNIKRGSDPVAVYAVGAESCGAWLVAREVAKSYSRDVRHLQFEAFVYGMATGYNLYVADAKHPDVLAGIDAYGQWAYLDRVCREDPHAKFVGAVGELFEHLLASQR
jgi:hypothetical protein